MEDRRNRTSVTVVVGVVVVALILTLGTMATVSSARKDTENAVKSVSMLYLDELAERREQVIEDSLEDNIRVIDIALDMLDDQDLSDLEHMRAYQRDMKRLFNLERFAFVDSNGQVYTADEGIQDDIDQYRFDYLSIFKPTIFIKDMRSETKRVVIAVPIRDRMLSIGDARLVACIMEFNLDVLLRFDDITMQNSETTFCNIYASDGTSLTGVVLGGAASEGNLFDALEHSSIEQGYSVEKMAGDFKTGTHGIMALTYDGVPCTLSYTPVADTGWMLTYLIKDTVVSSHIGSVIDSIILRSVVQSLLVAAVLAVMFIIIAMQMRSNAQLELEKKTSEAEARTRQQELQQRIELQEKLLQQKSVQDEQSEMISALAADYRSVYYIELDSDHGVCYQARTDLSGFAAGDTFDYLEAVTHYCNRYVMEPYRKEFLSFIQPDAIRAGLSERRIISHRYMIEVDGKQSWEAVHFASVHHPEDRDDGVVNNVGACFVDVDDETRKSLLQQEALSEALTEAEQANKAKTAFLSNMSHEIRTPMNAIIGLNSIALNEPDLTDKMRDYLLKIGASAQHLLGIINDILDMSRIESGHMTIKSEEFSFAKNLEQVNTIIGGQCSEKGLHYECRTVGKIDDCYVGDGGKLKQVMINILGNAVKFTPEGGSVTFIIEEGPRFDGKAVLKMVFSDTGVGMSEEYLPHLFDAFSQEDSSTTSRFGSTGLGMPITKSIVELMNGHIEVESKKDEGTIFTVTVTLGESEHSGNDDRWGEIDPAKMSVLVIDDDPVALEHAQIVLRQIGMACEVAGSGEEGLEMVSLRHARRNDYDLLLVDWKMPGMDGVETTRRIRAVVGDDMPIIILTSYNWDDVEEAARTAGVDTFLAKPLFAGSVLDEFRDAFKTKSAYAQERRASLEGRRVLLAEDMVVNAEIMVMVLGMREIEVDLAENGRIAVEKFSSQPAGTYDAILMDMRMPEMDGLEATRAIRASGKEDAATIPIIALTANAFDEDVQRSMQAGLNAHLSKPIEPDALFETLELLIGSAEVPCA